MFVADAEMASEKRIDDILCKMESTSAKVELYKTSKVKLPMAELDYLKTSSGATVLELPAYGLSWMKWSCRT